MKLLSLLFIAFILGLVGTKLIQGDWNWLFSGNLGMAVFMAFTGITHFKFQKGMTMMIPDIIPFKLFWVYFTGILEIVLAIGLLIPEYSKISAIMLIAFLVLVFMANVHAAQKKVNIFKADFTGPGMRYLYKERILMQIILIAWTWFFGIYLT